MDLSIGPLQINAYSVCFAAYRVGGPGVYVKIPKEIFYDERRSTIMPLTARDRRLATDEYESLVYLSQHWPKDETRVQYVQALEFLKDYNAIVTERIDASPFFLLFRRCDGRYKPGGPGDGAHDVMTRLGTALSRFHATSRARSAVGIDAGIGKCLACVEELEARGVSRRALEPAIRWLRSGPEVEVETWTVPIMKGLDVRQVFIDDRGTVFMLDPGKLKTAYQEQDLARFIVTCRLLYWGTPRLLLHPWPDPSYERAFLDGYYGAEPRPVRLLHLMIVKEILKHWRVAHAALAAQSWPALMKPLLRRFYLDPYFARLLRTELAASPQR